MNVLSFKDTFCKTTAVKIDKTRTHTTFIHEKGKNVINENGPNIKI